MIEIKNLTKKYNKTVIDDFSWVFPDKGLFLIKGKSGKGKTTLLRLISGLSKADSGEIKGTENKRISFLFQDSRLLDFYSVYKNIEIVRKEKNEAEIERLLRRFGLWEAKEMHPDELSGGMKKRCAIIRSIYFGGDIFLWDEPTSELDFENAELIADAMKEISKEHLMIAVTHDSILDDFATVIDI